MSALSDILALLDRWDQWKRIRTAPDRVDELEKRLAALESRSVVKKPTAAGLSCSLCGSPMRVTAETPHHMFGMMGLKEHALECTSCGHKTSADFRPGKGYDV